MAAAVSGHIGAQLAVLERSAIGAVIEVHQPFTQSIH